MSNVQNWLKNSPPSAPTTDAPSQSSDRGDDSHQMRPSMDVNDHGLVSPADDEAELSDTSSHFSTVSEDLPPAIRAYGHTYYGSGQIMFPNDASEAYRLGLQHKLFELCLNGGLTDSKLPFEHHSPDRPLQILDIGSGTGEWACEMGQRHPEVKVLGLDLSSSLLPKDVPPNVTFEIAEVTEPWPAKHYDFIHMRALAGGSIRDWAALLATAYDHLKPGGQLEFTELSPGFLDVDPENADQNKGEAGLSPVLGAACREFEMAFATSCAKLNIDFDPCTAASEWLDGSDCENVRARVDYLPFRGWGNDSVTHKKGSLLAEMIDKGIENWTVMLFGSAGWEEKDMQALMDSVKQEIQDPAFKRCAKVTFITARKPRSGRISSNQSSESASIRS